MWKVYVGNLDSRVKERELADEFRIYGNVRSVWVARNPPGYAFVEFDDRRDAEDAVSRLDGKHGWRVEMSRKSVGGGPSRSSYGSESRCYECGGVGHFARECPSRVSRHSRRRSPSPHSRSDNHSFFCMISNRYGLTRSGRGSSRSPRRDRQNSYRERSSPRRKRERSRSLESDKSDSRRHRGKGHRHGTSPQHEKPGFSSPYREEEELDKSPHNGTLENEHEEGQSPQNGDSETRGVNSQEGSQGSKSPLSERSEDVGNIQKEEYRQSGSPHGEESDIEGNGSPDVREDSRSPLPENINSFEDGESPLNRDSPLRNGNAGGSPEEESNGSQADRSPAEEIAKGHHSGESD